MVKIFWLAWYLGKKTTPPLGNFPVLFTPHPRGLKENSFYRKLFLLHHYPGPRGHFLKTRFLYKKIHAQQSAPKRPYVGRMNVGRGDRGEDSPGRAIRCHAGYHRCQKCATTGNLSGNNLIFVL